VVTITALDFAAHLAPRVAPCSADPPPPKTERADDISHENQIKAPLVVARTGILSKKSCGCHVVSGGVATGAALDRSTAAASQ
jgi:hypothetical protein